MIVVTLGGPSWLPVTDRGDIWTLPPGETDLQPFLVTDRNEYAPRFSPDGRWIAYVSDEAGQPNVYVRAYPPTERSVVRLVTSDGGYEPRWSRDGTTLYYTRGETSSDAVLIENFR